MKITKGAMTAMAALESARTSGDYARAKDKVARLDRLEQLAMVDSMKACRRRLESEGAL